MTTALLSDDAAYLMSSYRINSIIDELTEASSSKCFKYLDRWKLRAINWHSKLTFTHHFSSVRDKALGHYFTNTQRKLLYYLYIRPVKTYAAPIPTSTSKTKQRKLWTVQNKCLHLVGNFSTQLRILAQHTTLQVPGNSMYVFKLSLHFFNPFD